MKKMITGNKIICLMTIFILMGGFVVPGFCDCNLNAFPDNAQTAFSAAPGVPQPNPVNVQVIVGATSGVALTPTLRIPPRDIGTSQYLDIYIYLPTYEYGFWLPGKQATLGSFQQLDMIPPLDLSSLAGLDFIVYYCYIKANGDIMYNDYTVKIRECP